MTTALLPPWDPDEHDRRIKAERKANPLLPIQKPSERMGTQSSDYDGVPRGQATPAELARRDDMNKAMRRRRNQPRKY